MTRAFVLPAAGRRRPASTLGMAAALALVALLGAAPPAMAQFSQQGAKLVGSGYAGAAIQGAALALSADGSTAIVGGRADNTNAGAVWFFTRSNGTWTQQGGKQTVSDAIGSFPLFGYSAAVSADGNTALIGGAGDNSSIGAAWVFIRSNGVWTEQAKLVGLSNSGASEQGVSVALSADGNTALVGGPADNSSIGAAWVFVRSGSAWSQPSAKLTGTGEGGTGYFGQGVALSADGSTALVGGYGDNGSVGAFWTFTRSGNSWTQQGGKVTASNELGLANFGFTTALSGDGNTALVGGPSDHGYIGAAWVFSRSGGAWTQRAKLVGTGNSGSSNQGFSIALSADGSTALVGGPFDNNSSGAAWVFTRPGSIWSQQQKLVGTGSSGSAQQGISLALSADGTITLVGGHGDNGSIGAVWPFVQIDWSTASAATHDFNADGTSDILWRDSSGNLALWLISNGQFSSGATLGQVSTAWSVAATGDFNLDGMSDILWLDSSGDVAIWLMNGATLSSGINLGNVGTSWQVQGTNAD